MHYAIKNSYPIETKEQLKTASQYFRKYISRFTPSDRVVAACNLEKRASELSVNIEDGWVKNYSRVKKAYLLSPEFKSNLMTRMNVLANGDVKVASAGGAHDMSEILLKIADKAESMSPLDLINTIDEFDKTAGLEFHYDTKILDPIMTVLGSMNNPEYDSIKIASGLTDYDFSRASREEDTMTKVSNQFGEEFAAAFAAYPVESYEKMSTVDKTVVANILRG